MCRRPVSQSVGRYLAHICRYWRDVALATPFLWTEILIMGTNKYPLEKLETQLARSSNAPLKVLLWRSYSGQSDALIKKFIRLLVDCGPRWTNASLVIKPEHFALLSPLRGRIPLLRYLRIDISNSFDERPGPLSQDATNPFEIAPALRDVTLEDVSGLPYGLLLPFRQLTRLKLATNHRRIVALLSTLR